MDPMTPATAPTKIIDSLPRQTQRVGHLVLLASLFVTIILVIQGARVEPARACRDCPFPMFVADLHWRMPGGFSDVTIEEKSLGRGRVQSTVRLLETSSGQLLAIGHLDHFKGARRLRVPMEDFVTGGHLEANVTYISSDRQKVRIRFTCLECSLGSAYLQ